MKTKENSKNFLGHRLRLKPLAEALKELALKSGLKGLRGSAPSFALMLCLNEIFQRKVFFIFLMDDLFPELYEERKARRKLY